jgi:two-component system, NtrC family, response regulator HydG
MSELPDDFENEFQTLAQQRGGGPTAGGVVRVTVLSGTEKGQHIEFDSATPVRALIGTSEACALRLTDRMVSRRHLALDIDGTRIRVVDLGSKNGTRLGGIPIEAAFVEQEGVVGLGDTTLAIAWDHSRRARPISDATAFGNMLGASLAMRRLYPLCERLAAANIPVVIEGKTGTGKEALAEALHTEGPRAERPFLVFDCTAVPENLIESELFGHARGAFTGANAAHKGLFEESSGGTLFIDEIGDLPALLQPKLLRAIDRNEFRPLGSTQAIKADVRIIAATRRDLDREVQEGRFRDDLFHRLAVGRIELPPLRTRTGDIELLARHFWTALGGKPENLDSALLARWVTHDFPGNVRELRNTVSRHLALGELAELPESQDGNDSNLDAWVESLSDLPLSEAREKMIAAFERRYVARVLARNNGNVTQAAQKAGVARRYMQILKARSRDTD